MSVWREVQETLYQRWADGWGATTPFVFANEKYDPVVGPDGKPLPWARFSVQRLPGGLGTLGPRGHRKMDRAGLVFIQLFEPPLAGTGRISDLAEKAAKLFENCRFAPHDIRFAAVEPQTAGEVDGGRWWGLSAEGRFDYEEAN